jgi:hypothetical protein
LPTSDGYIDTHLREPLVEENAFLRMSPEIAPPPSFEDAWDSLPQPFWEGHEGAIDCYRGAWELAFANLRRPEPESGFDPNAVAIWMLGGKVGYPSGSVSRLLG